MPIEVPFLDGPVVGCGVVAGHVHCQCTPLIAQSSHQLT